MEKAKKNHINGLMNELDILEKAKCVLGLSLIDREGKNDFKMVLANKLNL